MRRRGDWDGGQVSLRVALEGGARGEDHDGLRKRRRGILGAGHYHVVGR